jgi:hypothetical protein
VTQYSNELWEIACRHFDVMEPNQEIPMLCRAIAEERQAVIDCCRKLATHQVERGQFQDAFTSNFIANQLESGAHRAGRA